MDTIIESKQANGRDGRNERGGWLTTTFEASLGLSEKATETAFGVVRDVQSEVHRRVGSVIDWVDGSQQGVIKLTRDIESRVEKLSRAIIDAAESIALGTVRAARDATQAANQMSSRMVITVVGTPSETALQEVRDRALS